MKCGFIRDHFDKLMLFSMFIGMVGSSMWFSQHGDMDTSHWMREKAGEVVAAQLILMTGRGILKQEPTPPPLPPEAFNKNV